MNYFLVSDKMKVNQRDEEDGVSLFSLAEVGEQKKGTDSFSHISLRRIRLTFVTVGWEKRYVAYVL